jgi:hypothetical protein
MNQSGIYGLVVGKEIKEYFLVVIFRIENDHSCFTGAKNQRPELTPATISLGGRFFFQCNPRDFFQN